MKIMEQIVAEMPMEELLCQLAEEAAELSMAALKYRRAMGGKNPTPVTEQMALENLVEECADVKVCLLALKAAGLDLSGIDDVCGFKIERWAERLHGTGRSFQAAWQSMQAAGRSFWITWQNMRAGSCRWGERTYSALAAILTPCLLHKTL